jgi:hypothetical protein
MTYLYVNPAICKNGHEIAVHVAQELDSDYVPRAYEDYPYYDHGNMVCPVCGESIEAPRGEITPD